MEKSELRNQMRTVLGAISPEERHTRSLDVCHQLRDTLVVELNRNESICAVGLVILDRGQLGDSLL